MSVRSVYSLEEMAQPKKYDKQVLQNFQVQSFAAQQKELSTEYQRKDNDNWSSSSTSSDSDKDLGNNNDININSNSNSNSNNLGGAPIFNKSPITRKKTVTTAKTEPIINICSGKVSNMSNLPSNTIRFPYNPARPECVPWCSEVFLVKNLVGVKKKSFYNGYTIMI